ncbi:hypothetical protein D3C78_800790 [compost metagenome]
MGIGPARAKGGNPGQARPDAGFAVDPACRSLPRAQAALHVERAGGEVDIGVERRRVQRRRQLSMLELQQHLADAGDPGGTFTVADVGFDRADGTELCVLGVAGKGPGQAGDFDRVAQGRAGAMGFDVAHRLRRHPSLVQRRRDQLSLGRRVGHGVAVGLAAVVEHRGFDDAVDLVTVGNGLGLAFEQHRPHALPRDISLAAFAEALATALGRGKAALAQHQVLVGVNRDIDPARQCHIALAIANTATGQVQGGDGRGTHGVQGNAGALQVEDVGHAIGNRGRMPGHREGKPAYGGLSAKQLVFLVHHPDKHPDVPALAASRSSGQVGAGVTGVLQGFVGTLQEQALLGFHTDGFPWRDTKKQGVELVDVVDKTTVLAIRLADGVFRRVVEALMIPPLRRDLADQVLALGQALPERLHGARAGIATGQADDRNFIVAVGIGRRRWQAHDFQGHRDHGRLLDLDQRQQDVAMLCQEVVGDFTQRLVLEKQRLGQATEGFLQLIGEANDDDRIDAVLFQLGVFVKVRFVEAQGAGKLLAHIRQRRLTYIAWCRGRTGHPARYGLYSWHHAVRASSRA